MPKIPAILETRFDPRSLPSCRRISPEGLSMTRVGVLGEDGEEKA